MDRVFNMGIGLVLIVAEYYAEAIVRQLSDEARTPAWIIGEVVPGDRNIVWDDSLEASEAR
jgi:phosphoribosylformylglycinamidine cyclo-ligase